MRSDTDIFTLGMSGCSPAFTDLIRLLICFIVALSICTSFLDDALNFFTSKAELSVSTACLLAWSHLFPKIFSVVVSEWVRYCLML